MIRLAPTPSRRVASIAAAVLLMPPMVVSAQLSMPQGTPNRLPNRESNMPVPSLASGRALIEQARAAMKKKDVPAAVRHYRKAAGMKASAPQLANELKQLKAKLVAAGIHADLLKPITSAGGVGPDAPVEDRKREALRLVALGRAALDRGDVAGAVAMAHRAQALKVPETAFEAGEPRVWEFVLDAESAARRGDVSAAAGGVQNAGGAMSGGDAGEIAQTLFDGGLQKPGRAVRQVQNESPLAIDADSAGRGEELYREGMRALSEGDNAGARAKFVEAWKYEGEIDLETRAQLKEKLTLLQPSRLPGVSPDKSDRPLTPIQRAELESQQKTQRLYREVQAELSKANELRESKPLEAVEKLESLLRRVEGSDIDQNAKRNFAAMVTGALTSQRKYVEAHRAEIDLKLRNEGVQTEMAIDKARQSRVEEEVTLLVDEFNELIEERRYPEAEVVAKQVAELKPGSDIAASMFHLSRMQTRLLMNQEVRDELEDSFVRNMLDVERSAIMMDPKNPIDFAEARTWTDLSTRRLSEEGESGLSQQEQLIKRKLSGEQVDVNYRNRPLNEVVDELSAMLDMNIVIDTRALAALRIEPDVPVSLSVPKALRLKSALNLILDSVDLTYVIDNDSLMITTREAKRSRVYSKVYRVTDLVTPIPNFTTSYDDGLAGALRAAYQMASPQADVQVMPVSATDLGTGMAQEMSPAKMGPNMLGQYNPMGASSGFGPSGPPASGRGGGSFADFDSLMQLIQTTVVPDTWEALGGPSTMAPYAQNLSLVVSTTSDVHDQIADLLESLRRLQNLQITIEVRFITLSDSFFEQIGVDFDVQLDDNIDRLPDEDESGSVTIGFGGDGLPTADFDIRFNNNAFGLQPPFGGFDPATAGTFGWAILSDIEAFFFLQAAQGDSRNNVMQAPKVTLFDGQFASISDVSQRPFVTSITPVVGDFAVAQQPVIVVLNEGTQLNVQGVVSDDKRFVRLTLVPFFSQIGDVDTFTFEGTRTSRSSSREEEDTNGDGVVDEDDAIDTEEEEEVVSGTTVQLPTFAFTSVSTTVSVPDGGTILLGGIKRLSEGREERGVPMLSKIPYISRLFRNVSVGRDATSLMLMVTPRIIIQEEEEIAQTGFDPRQ